MSPYEYRIFHEGAAAQVAIASIASKERVELLQQFRCDQYNTWIAVADEHHNNADELIGSFNNVLLDPAKMEDETYLNSQRDQVRNILDSIHRHERLFAAAIRKAEDAIVELEYKNYSAHGLR